MPAVIFEVGLTRSPGRTGSALFGQLSVTRGLVVNDPASLANAVNVFSPGGLGSCESLYKTRFTDAVIESLERKVEVRRHHGTTISNTRLATL